MSDFVCVTADHVVLINVTFSCSGRMKQSLFKLRPVCVHQMLHIL